MFKNISQVKYAFAVAFVFAFVLVAPKVQAAAPAGTSAAVASSTSTTVTMTVTGTDFAKFVSADATTANATDLAKITYRSSTPTAATTNGTTTLTLTFDICSVTCGAHAINTDKSGSLVIAADALKDGSDVNNTTITIVNGSITDTARPQVVSTTPTSAATAVSRSADLVINMSEPMDTTTLAFSTNPAFTYTPTWTNSNKTVTLAHASQLNSGSFTATLTNATVAIAGTPAAMTADYTWSFVTAVTTNRHRNLVATTDTTTTVPVTPVAVTPAETPTTPASVTPPATTPDTTNGVGDTATITNGPVTLTITQMSPSTVTVPFAFKTSLKMGVTSEDVTSLQKFLVSTGLLTMPSGVSMGYYGALTAKAVGDFQVKYGIAKKGEAGFGVFGPKTRTQAGVIASAPTLVQTPAQ